MTVERVKLAMEVFVSLTLLAASGYVVLSGDYPDATLKWAFGIIGYVSGHWIR